MPKMFKVLKERVMSVYNFIVELEKIPMRNFAGDFYEEKTKEAPLKRKNNVRVEDLRPKKND